MNATDWLWFVYGALPAAVLLDMVALTLGLWCAKLWRQRRARK